MDQLRPRQVRRAIRAELNAFEVIGAGPPLVLVPGTFSDRRTWGKQVGALSGRFTVVLFDPRGVGASADPGTAFGPDELVDDLLAVMDATSVERADLCGHSLGAHVALLAAARHPDRVRRVVAAAPTLYVDAHLEACLDLWDALVRSDLPDHDVNAGIALLSFGRAVFDRLVPAVVREMDANPIPRATMRRYVECDRRQDLRGLAGRIDAPVLVVCGDDDALPGPGQARATADAIPGARLEIVAGTGHGVHVEAAAAFNRLVANFLTSV